MKIIITQYALSTGVIVCEVQPKPDYPRMVTICDGSQRISFFKPHWHTDKSQALAGVRHMAEAKRKSLEKQLANLPAKLAAAEKAIEEAQL